MSHRCSAVGTCEGVDLSNHRAWGVVVSMMEKVRRMTVIVMMIEIVGPVAFQEGGMVVLVLLSSLHLLHPLI